MAIKSLLRFLEANRVAVGSFTRDKALASGNQAVEGLGFKPRVVIFFMAYSSAPEASWGLDDGSISANSGCVADDFNVTPNSYVVADTYSIYARSGGGANYRGYISSLDVDGFTITWNRILTPTGTITIQYIAYK